MVLSIPNYLNGKFVEEGTKKILKDCHGKDFAVIYSATSRELRSFKRNVNKLQEELQKIPLKKIFNLISKVYNNYYNENIIINSAKLTGTPISFAVLTVHSPSPLKPTAPVYFSRSISFE